MKLQALLVLLIFVCVFGAKAQSYDPAKVDKKAVALFEDAKIKVEDGKNAEAIRLLNEATAKDPRYIDAYLMLGYIYRTTAKYPEAVAIYEKAFAIDPVFTADFKLPYSIGLAGMGNFEKALAVINNLLADSNLHIATKRSALARKQTFEFAVNMAKKREGTNYLFTPVNMGDKVNSAESEYLPALTIDRKVLMFTRKLNHFNEDFFESKLNNSQWDQSTPAQGNVNTSLNEGALNISQDGNWLVFTGCDRQDGYGSCDIYVSFLEAKGWSEAENMGKPVNSEFWDSQPCLSPDKTTLYFASRRPGGFGGSDLYFSKLRPDGTWSVPENMGSDINTKGDEQCPFIHADNQTFYFTSNGHQGYGDADLFYSKRIIDKWSAPVNLGYPINTIDQEGSLFIAADGKTAYYSSDRSDSKGGMDLYSFELPEDVRSVKTLWVKGQVFDNKTKKGLPSAVELIDLSSKQTLSRVQTDEHGRYLITLPIGKDYAFNVNRPGYLFYSDNFSLSQRPTDSTYEKDIPLLPIEANASIILRNIFFDVNKFDLKPESQVELDKIVQLLNDNPTLRIEISGHTDNEGTPAANLALSNSRAKSVVNYLQSKGIASQRLQAKGYGETKPVADNKTADGRAVNRRTEMKVISR